MFEFNPLSSMGFCKNYGDTYVKGEWFKQINSGASGTLSATTEIGTSAEFLADCFASDVDMVVSTVTSGRKPDFEPAVTAAGVIVTATFTASTGAWALVGTPSAYPVALVYQYKQQLRFYDISRSLIESELLGNATIDHGSINGLTDDDHTQYLLANGTRAIQPAADSTTAFQMKDQAGNVDFNYDSTNGRVGIGTATPSAVLDISPGTITTDALKVNARDANNAFQLKVQGHTGGYSHLQITTDQQDSRISLLAGAQNDSAPRFQAIGAQDTTDGVTPSSARGSAIFDYGSYIYNVPNAKFTVRNILNTGTPVFTTMMEVVGNNILRFPTTTVKVGVCITSPAAQLHVVAGAATNIAGIVQGAASQSANLQEWQKSDATIYSGVDATGNPFCNDSIYSYFGTGRDARIWYDGTDLNINPKVVGTGVLNILGNLVFNAPARLKGYTVATLPAGTQGDLVFATDLLAPAFLAIAVGGGAVVGMVFYNGTNWVTV